METRTLLKFSDGNAKLDAVIKTLSLPAGWTCPGADQCLARVQRNGGLQDGPNVRFRCFSASGEQHFKATRDQRWFNLDLLKECRTSDAMAELISASLPRKATKIRIHVSGDFFSPSYFLAWCQVAREHPAILFYAYTKSIPTWRANLAAVPSNLVLTASLGGKYDALADGLKTARVVFSIEEAARLGLPIDHDDSHAMNPSCKAFALLVHNVQPAGSEASKAVSALAKLSGIGSYSNDRKVNAQRASMTLAA